MNALYSTPIAIADTGNSYALYPRVIPHFNVSDQSIRGFINHLAVNL